MSNNRVHVNNFTGVFYCSENVYDIKDDLSLSFFFFSDDNPIKE